MSAGCMAVAAYAVFATKGVGWLWNMGGVEYLAMWALVSLAPVAQRLEEPGEGLTGQEKWEAAGISGRFATVEGRARGC